MDGPSLLPLDGLALFCPPTQPLDQSVSRLLQVDEKVKEMRKTQADKREAVDNARKKQQQHNRKCVASGGRLGEWMQFEGGCLVLCLVSTRPCFLTCSRTHHVPFFVQPPKAGGLGAGGGGEAGGEAPRREPVRACVRACLEGGKREVFLPPQQTHSPTHPPLHPFPTLQTFP